MLNVSLPSNEPQRLQALHRYRVLNSTPDPVLDGFIRLAATLCGVPIAFVGFLDTDWQILKACLGWEHHRIPRPWTLCNETILQADVFTIVDFATHPSLTDHPILNLDPALRFYAGVPLLTIDRFSLGTLAVLDHCPHHLSPDQRDGLLTLSQSIMTHLQGQEYQQQLRQMQRQQEKSDVELHRHALIFAHIHDGLIVLDLGGRIIDANPGATAMFGWAKSELLGKTTQILHPESLGSTGSLKIVKAVLSEGSWKAQKTVIRKDGSTGTAEVIAVPLQNSRKQTIAILVIYHDISDRELAELAWEHQKAILQTAEQTAQAANQAKSDFLSRIIHEIRTPMSAVMGMADILGETPLNPEQRDFLRTLHTAGESLVTIVNEVLDLSKLESGHFELESYGFNLRDCLENTLDLFATRAADKGLGLFYTLEPEVPLILEGDGNRLGQVLINLVGNALKFTEQGEITVTIALGEPKPLDSSQPLTVQFAVQDTGIGIAPDRQAAIFSPYIQAEVSTARYYGGTGLGLTISRQLVELMGGTLWVESTVGQGSTFYFTIPLTRPANQAGATPGDPQLSLLQGKRLLIVDQNSQSQRSLVRQGEQWGMATCSVGSSTEAINHLRWGDPIDVVLLDWNVADMDGFTLARQMHRLPNYRFLPLILMTTLEQDDRWATQIDFITRLFKPIKHQALQKALIQAFQPSSAEPQGFTPSQSIYDRTLGQRYPLRILLAEDNPVNQKVMTQILDRLGYHPVLVNNGQDVLEALRKSFYDLVLMDVSMPVLDGWETTRRIKQDESAATPSPRIVALTAHALPQTRQQCEAAGMDGYLSKPLRIQELTQILKDTATHRAMAAAEVILPPKAVNTDALQSFMEELTGGDTFFLKDLIETYLHETAQYLQQLQHHYPGDEGDDLAFTNPDFMYRILHTLKSSCGSMFAHSMADFCRQLEIEFSGYDRSQRVNALQKLCGEFDRVQGELQSLLGSLQVSP
ncbi:MAG: response regulator [Prochlorotrichaceae cyanobacterium]